MENPRTIPEIRLITEGILAVANFHFSLEEWELTKAGRKAKKEERKLMKKTEKTKKGEESTQRETITKEQEKKKNCDIETVVDENVLEKFVASFCKGLIQEAIHELLEDESGSVEAICNIKTVVDFEEEIKYKIESLEKGEGDTGRAVTVADLRDNDIAKEIGAQSCDIATCGYLEVERDGNLEVEPDGNLEVEPDGNLEVEPDGNLEVEPEVRTETSLDDEEPVETGQNTIKSSGEKQMKKSDNKVEDYENVNTKLSPKDAKAEKKREKKERKKKKKLEAEQIKATKKYFEKIEGAMRRRSLMLSVYWDKTVEENKKERKRQEKMRREELKRERKEQKAQEKKKMKESKTNPKEESAQEIDSPVYAIEGQQESCFNRVQNVKADQGCNSQDGGHKKAEQSKHEKTKLNIGSRIIRFLARLYSEDVF